MAKIFISADIEGISGISLRDFTTPKSHGWELGRKYMVEDINAAIAGILAASPESEIVVRDAHGGSDNIILEKLHPAAGLISGWPHNFNMLQGLDSTFDACFFIGYHSRALVPGGILSHTFNRIVRKVTINGVVVGESGINAFLAGGDNVPVALITGDDKLKQEVSKILPDTGVAVVKIGISRQCSQLLPRAKSKELIRNAAVTAVKNIKNLKPFLPGRSADFKVYLSYSDELRCLEALSDFKTVLKDTILEVTIKGKNPKEIYDRFAVIVRLTLSIQ